MIDLRSDTVTRPTPAMLEAMMNARVGDDVFGEDPTVNELEEMSAVLFGKEAALFCPSGTMTNQVAIHVHCKPGDDLICDQTAHVYQYEGGGIAANSGTSASLIHGNLGRFNADQVRSCINPDDLHKPVSRLVVVENTSNRGGGSTWEEGDIADVQQVCQENDLKLHLDGARIFNALAVTGTSPQRMGRYFDSISICLSKGLGAPVGSLIVGSNDFISRCRRVRKRFGGGMRQGGYMAAAGIYALEHHVARLTEDHRRASELHSVLTGLPYVVETMPVQTNIIVFKLEENKSRDKFLDDLKKNGLLAVPFGPQTIRLVTHLDITDEMIAEAIRILENLA